MVIRGKLPMFLAYREEQATVAAAVVVVGETKEGDGGVRA